MIENEMMIAQKKAEIKKLQGQIKELECPKTLYNRVDGKMLMVKYDGTVDYAHFSGNEPWNCIKKMGLELFRPKKDLHRSEHMTVKMLTHEEAETIGDMASEMIEIWNRYVRKVYGGGSKLESDLISRQAAIDAVEKAVFKGVAKSAIESLPPVEPKRPKTTETMMVDGEPTEIDPLEL